MARWRWLGLIGLLLAGGCSYAVRERIDTQVGSLATLPVDAQPVVLQPAPPLPPAKEQAELRPAKLVGPVLGGPVMEAGIRTASFQEAAQKQPAPGKEFGKQLEVKGIPGADTPFPLKLPANNDDYQKALQKYFPPLSPLPTIEAVGQVPLTLGELQRLALLQNPQVRQAAADVETARGNALQAGLPPNPTAGIEADTMRQSNSAGIIGAFAQQTIITGGKLQLAQLAALMDLRAAEQKLRGSEADLQAQVRQNYFNVLSAQENLRVSLALAKLSDQMYELLLTQLRNRLVTPYEVYSLRVVAQQTRSNVIQTRNRYYYAWKQLGIVVGQPNLARTELAGRIDMPIPRYHAEDVLERVLQTNSEVLAAQAAVEKARYQLKLAQVTPLPNFDVRVMVQRDYTTPPFGTVPSITIGVPIPLWDRNQGNIQAAQAQYIRAVDDLRRVELMLRNKLADAFERYDTNRAQLELYRDQILPHQVLAFRGLVARYAAEGDKGGINYNDIVTSEQTLVNVVNTYLTELLNQWTAVVDIAGLLQTRDLFQVSDTDPVAPIPALEGLWPEPWRGRLAHHDN